MPLPEIVYLPNGQQLSLLPEDDVTAAAARLLETSGDFTGERLQAQHPRIYQALIRLLEMGATVRQVAHVLGVSPNTVLAARELNPTAVDTGKHARARDWRVVEGLALVGLTESLDSETKRADVSARDLAVIAGISSDHAELLAGGVTARLGIVDEIPPARDAYATWLASLRNVTPATGCGEQTAEQKGAADLGQAPAVAQLEAPATVPATVPASPKPTDC
jgi:hypothetical protein